MKTHILDKFSLFMLYLTNTIKSLLKSIEITMNFQLPTLHHNLQLIANNCQKCQEHVILHGGAIPPSLKKILCDSTHHSFSCLGTPDEHFCPTVGCKEVSYPLPQKEMERERDMTTRRDSGHWDMIGKSPRHD